MINNINHLPKQKFKNVYKILTENLNCPRKPYILRKIRNND